MIWPLTQEMKKQAEADLAAKQIHAILFPLLDEEREEALDQVMDTYCVFCGHKRKVRGERPCQNCTAECY